MPYQSFHMKVSRTYNMQSTTLARQDRQCLASSPYRWKQRRTSSGLPADMNDLVIYLVHFGIQSIEVCLSAAFRTFPTDIPLMNASGPKGVRRVSTYIILRHSATGTVRS